MTKIGILHPGEMGVSIAASAINSGHEVYWASQSRSEKTRLRAEQQRLIELLSVEQLCQTCEIILSVCPPHAAEKVASSVLEAGFKGLYLDANAIAPQRATELGKRMDEAGVRFVDGGIIGGPAWKPNETWLYLSGEHAPKIAACFSNGPLETNIVGSGIGKASALKMCYAAHSKGTTALLAAIVAAAEALDVRQELYTHWDRDSKGFSGQVNQRVLRVTAKAWRFEGEMREIALTLQAAGLPDGFHTAAAEVFDRITGYKDDAGTPPLEDVIRSLLNK
jgi:3-hydroxyisobutyrate dehydrogenase-like beta-hydroxyacid dehydrogenase